MHFIYIKTRCYSFCHRRFRGLKFLLALTYNIKTFSDTTNYQIYFVISYYPTIFWLLRGTQCTVIFKRSAKSWWRHQMETFSALLAICAGNSPVTGEFPATRNFDVFFDLRLNKWLNKQSWGGCAETPSSPLWRHCNDNSSDVLVGNK